MADDGKRRELKEGNKREWKVRKRIEMNVAYSPLKIESCTYFCHRCNGG